MWRPVWPEPPHRPAVPSIRSCLSPAKPLDGDYCVGCGDCPQALISGGCQLEPDVDTGPKRIRGLASDVECAPVDGEAAGGLCRVAVYRQLKRHVDRCGLVLDGQVP